MKNVLVTLRNNWKKSVFFGCLGSYGVKYGLQKRQESALMKTRCLEALKMGQVTKGTPTNITVILNPAADSGKARSKYESYCAPLLHLAGAKVSVIRTEGMGQAKEIMGLMKDADAVLVAGGDGTLMESLSGLLRRSDEAHKSIILGVLPIGKENRLAKVLFTSHAGNDVDLMSAATMGALRNIFRPLDVLQVSDAEGLEEKNKLFGLRSLKIGAFRDVNERKGKFWFFGPLKDLFAYVFSYSTSHKEINWDLNGDVSYSQTERVEKVVSAPQESTNTSSSATRWPLSLFFGSSKNPAASQTISFKRIYEWISLPTYRGLELYIASANETDTLDARETDHNLGLRLGPSELSFSDFVTEGWSREKGTCSEDLYTQLSGKAFRFIPGVMSREEVKFSLDNEAIDLRASGLEVSLLPNKVNMFCSKECHFELPPDLSGDERAKALSKKKWMQSAMRPSLSSPAKLI